MRNRNVLMPRAVSILVIAMLMPTIVSAEESRQTRVEIVGEAFHINGRPTYEGRTWNGHKIEGLLFNARLVQGIFDDLNPETVDRWAYPDTGEWDAERNTREFVAAMPDWRAHGLLSFTINLQGGSPEGYSQEQPWHNSAFTADGSLRPDYMERLERILDRADELGMAPIVGLFYFGQDERLEDDAAVKRAVVNAVDWIAERGYTNVLLEVANECDNGAYQRDIIKADRVHELIELARRRAEEHDQPLPIGVSYNGGSIPGEKVVETADFVLLHGNGVRDPDRMAEMIRIVREMDVYTPKPIIINEDDNYRFDEDWNNLVACIDGYASWGFFDFRRDGEDFDEGYQSVPANWQISSERKRRFFDLLREITGVEP